MKFRMFLLVLLGGFSNSVVANIQCAHLEGRWQGSVFNYEKNYHSEYDDVFEGNGNFTSHYNNTSLNGADELQAVILGETTVQGNWHCEGNYLIMNITEAPWLQLEPMETVYEITRLDAEVLNYRTMEGVSVGIEYSAHRSY
jgi:hypothetical protein